MMIRNGITLLVLCISLTLTLTACDDDDGSMGGMSGTDATTFDVTIENVGTAYPLTKSGAFNTPEGASEPGPLQPGDAYTFSFTAGPNEVPNSGMQLSFATMFIQSNDVFYAPQPGGIALFESDGTPIGAGQALDVTDQVALWDAGTEVDQEPGTGEDQAPRQSGLDTGTDENGSIVEITDTDGDGRLEDDGFEYPAVDETIRVTVASENDGATGSIRFTVRIENVGSGMQINGQPNLISPGAYAAHFDQVPGSGAEVAFFQADAPESESIDGIEEIAEDGMPGVRVSASQALTGITVPLSPGAYAVHSDAVQLFTLGEAASAGVEDIAEDGMPGVLGSGASEIQGVSSAGTFGSGPIAPTPDGEDPSRYTFSVEATPGDRLSFATMYIQSNDLFYAPDPAGLALFSQSGTPISGQQQVFLYDAGTEGDQEPGTGLDQAPRQSGTDTGPAGEGSVAQLTDTNGNGQPDNDGFEYLPNAQVIRVTVTPR